MIHDMNKRYMKWNQFHTLLLNTAVLLLLFLGSTGAWAQAVIMNGNYYLTHNAAGTAVNTTATTTFDPATCLWDYSANNYIRPANNNGAAINANNNYLQYSSLTLGNNNFNWYNASNGSEVYHRTGGMFSRTYYYLRRNGTTWQINSTDSNNGTLYDVTITSHNLADNTTRPTISIGGVSGNTITLNHTNLTGSYTEAYTTYRFNSANHNWYNNTDNGTSTPTVNVNTLSPTYTWSIVTGGDYADINPSTGALTVTGNPTGNITVRLTVGNISPLSDKTVDFTLTRTNVARSETTSATISAITLTPTSATLDLAENQEFTASATATATTTIIPAHVTLTGGGNTYYYYDNTLHAAAPAAEVTNSNPPVNYAWALTGAASSNLTLSATSGTTTKVIYATGSSTNASATLTVTASTTGASNRTATATINVNPIAATSISANDLIIYMGENGAVEYALTPMGSYDRVRATSGNTSVFTVNASPVSGGSVAITPVAPGQTTLTLVSLRPDGTNGPSTQVNITVRDRVAAPEISFAQDGSNVKVTMTCATAGATIRYTTDGSDPATSATAQTYNDSNRPTVSDGTTVKAVATKGEGWDNSAVVEATCNPIDYVEPGADGTTVILKDLEDHNWTYYSGVDASIDQGNYNTNYRGKIYSPNPRNVKITYNGVNGITGSSTTVKVSINESESSFVYYKTLEESTTSGEYQYQVISNPFSVRPSTGSGNSKVYYGFAGWKIVSGGEYIKGHSNNDVLSLDEEIVFNNLPYPSVNCTSAEIVFETTWTRATVRTGNNITNMLSNFSGGTYETNFAVLTGAYTNAWTGNKNCTVTSVYPDGSTDSRSSSVYTRLNLTLNAGYTVKYEYININNNNTTFSMGSGTKTLYIGRGVSNTTTNGVVCNLIQGYNDAITSGGLTYTLKIESGVYNILTYIKGYDESQQTQATATVTGTVAVKSVLGCDYDRAKGDNSKLKIQSKMFFGYAYNGYVLLRSPSAGDEVLNVTFKSGSLNSDRTDAGTADAGQSFYIGIGGEYSPGYRVFTMEGGEMWSLAAGICDNTATTNSIRFRIKGGLIKGSIYGSAANANSYGYKQMILTGGQVKGWIAGGGNGTSANGGVTTGSSYVYVGGNCRVDSEGSNTSINSSVGGQIFGSGSGVPNTTTWGEMLYGSNVVVADNAYVERDVFGGGNFGWTDQYATIYLTGDKMSCRNVYGGANQNKGENVRIYMTGGTVREGLYGGSNTSGTISGDVTMKINGGQVGTSSQAANIHGGGYGSSTVVNGWVTLTLGQEGQTEGGVTVYGDVYGGSALGEINGTAANSDYYTRVTLNKGTINGSLYGGGLGNNTYAADVNGPVIVTVNGGSVKTTAADGSGAVYGCNNISGAPQRSVTVIINGTDPAPDENTYALDAVYGGGNKANYSFGTPTVTVNNCDNSIAYVYGGGNAAHITNGGTDVTIYGGNKIGTVFGGGNGTVTPANVSGDTNVKIYGGTIGQVFGGSNSKGTIGGTINVTIQKQGSCAMHIDEVYGGGNMAASNAGNLTIGCTGNEGEGIGDVYGGANAADITGNIALNITGGSINRVFGGNNASGSISGTIQVDINWATGSLCGYNYLGSVFGGGNQAAYGNAGQNKGNYPVVNIFNGTVSEDVFGGGLGSTAIVYGNPQVTIGDATAEHKAIVKGDVYGGGDAAAVNGTPVVKVVNKCNTEIGNVYGGGNAADVTATNVTINGGTVKGDVYGGGHGDKSADVSANVNGNVSLSVTGGTINRVFGGSNSQGSISGTISVNINKGNESCDMKIGEVYGGGNEAAGNAGSITIGCTGTPNLSTIDATHRLGYELEGIGDVYGGANAADIGTSGTHSDITLNIQGGAINRVFGGNNTSGTIYGDIEVNIDWSGSCTNYLYDVFGCGNVADYSGSSTVNLINGDVSHCVYGGGNEADAGTAATYIKGGTVASGVYGGCNTSGTATGDITVGVTGGTIGTSLATANVHGGGYGSATASEGNVTVSVGTMSGGVNSGTGVIYGDVYGGSALGNVNSDTSDNTNVNLLSGTVHGDVYGGGLGDSENAALVKGNVVVKLNEGVTTTKGCIVDGRIFGCNNANGTPQGLVTVYVYATQKADKANVTEKADKGSDTFDVQAVYGGGNQAAYQPTNLETGKSKVVINGCGLTSIGYVYGGGNAASSPATEVEVNSAYEIDYVFGGGNGKDALPDGTENPGAHVGYLTWEEGSASNVAYGTGIATTNLYGGTINHVFGGSNTKGNVREVAVAMLDEGGDCDLVIEEIYGGGNEAYMEGKGSINLGCVTYMKEVYGGAKNAPVGNDVELTITSGHFDRVFGGNNIGGAINGSITVNIEETGCNPITIGELYGCGNAAAYTTPAGKSQPTINIKSCTSIGRVFGGGFGSTADVTGSPVVNINEVVGENSTTASTYAGTTRTLKDGTTVTLPPHTSGAIGAIGTVYGGGNAAQVTGNTTVHIGTQPTISYVSGNDHSAKTVIGANITGNVFGGGLGSTAVVTGNTDVVIGK